MCTGWAQGKVSLIDQYKWLPIKDMLTAAQLAARKRVLPA